MKNPSESSKSYGNDAVGEIKISDYIKLNLGCGTDKKKGYINIDKLENVKPDIIADFEEPDCLKDIKDNSAEEVLIIDCLEHINNLFPFMEELYRVCKPGAIVRISVPYWSHYLSCIDPTHVRNFNEGTFQFFSKAFYKHERGKTQTSQIPINFDFKTKKMFYVPDKSYEECSFEELQLYNKTQINVIKQLNVELEAIK